MKNIVAKIKSCLNKVDDYWNKFINLKYNKFIFKFLPHNILLFILLLISIISIFFAYTKNHYVFDYYRNPSLTTTHPILIYPYEIDLDNIKLKSTPDKVCFKMATYNNDVDSVYDLSLMKGEEMVFNIPIQTKNIVDNELYCEKIPPILNNENIGEYKIRIRPITADSDNAIAIYKDSTTDKVGLYFAHSKKLLSIHNIILLVFFIILLILNYLINNKKIKIEKFYLLVSIVYSILIAIIIPPFQVPDEQIHFFSTVNISQSNLNISEHVNNGMVNAPENISCLYYSNPQKTDMVMDFEEVIDCFKPTDNVNKKSNLVISNIKMAHIITALGYKLFDIFTNSPMILFYLGRLFNTIISILLIFLAIKITPKYKELFISAATIPVFIQQMVSYSYDSLLNSSILLSLAIMLKLIEEPNKNKKIYYPLLLIIGLLIANIKLSYIFIYSLLLFIPRNEKKKKIKINKYLKYIGIISLIILVFVVGNYISTIPDKEKISIFTNYNLNLLLKNPLRIFPLIINTFYRYTLFYVRGMFGYFGWMKYRFNDLLILIYVIYFIYLIKANKKIETKKSNKVIYVLCLLVSLATIFAAMYFFYSARDLGYIEGVQGRYILPLLLPFAFVLMPKKEKFKINIINIYAFINVILFTYVELLLIWYY